MNDISPDAPNRPHPRRGDASGRKEKPMRKTLTAIVAMLALLGVAAQPANAATAPDSNYKQSSNYKR